MSLKQLLVASAAVAFIAGGALVFAPEWLLSLHGIVLTPAGITGCRLLGAFVYGFALLNWFSRDREEGWAQRPIVLANLAVNAMLAPWMMIATLNGIVSALGWATTVLSGLLTLAFGLTLVRLNVSSGGNTPVQ